jgi:HlyD family secretion protein
MRLIIPATLVISSLVGLIAYRLHLDRQAQNGPAGGSGQIEATTVDLAARIGARITDRYVSEGAAVRKGDLLLRLDCSDPLAQIAEAKARVAAAQAQAQAAGAAVTATQSSRAAALAAQEAASAQAAALQAQKEAAERQAARLESIPLDVPAANVDQTRATAQGLAHQVAAALAQASASAAQARVVSVQINASNAQAEAARAQIVAAEANLERAALLVAECEVHAPVDAVISSLPHEPGELVGVGNVLVRLMRLDELTATFYLPNAELAAAKPGAEAEVVVDAWPGEKFEAKVRTVALEAEFTPRNIQTRSDRDRLVYPVEVVLTQVGDKLRPGMPVQVTLPGTERHAAR